MLHFYSNTSILKCTMSLGRLFVILATATLLTQTIAAELNEPSTNQKYSFGVSTHDLIVLVEGNKSFEILLSGTLDQDISISLLKQHESLVDLQPNKFTFSELNSGNQTVNVFGLQPGYLDITAKSVPDEPWIVEDLFVRVTVARSEALIYASIIFGWIYFLAWSISFYPQIYINYKRKSVVGLNFDFLSLNIVGFMLYSVFNCGLYWIPEIQDEYASRHPRGMNPVLLNDVVFSLHSIFATTLTIFQCFIYERADQKVSRTASGILGVSSVIVLITAILAAVDVMHWLDFLYYCSYIKLAISIVKCVPQAVMNYRRKSTLGWSIGNVLLDFTGGITSMLQMLLNAHNYDDWISIFGDPTKFGLGMFAVLFDVLFILQHYVFYRHSTELSTSTLSSTTEVTKSSEVTNKKDEKQYP